MRTLPSVMRSLRFRLPVFFLLGIVLGGFVASAIALRLFQGYTRERSFDELRREASGIAQLYANAALRAVDEGADAPDFAPDAFERATGDRLFYVGAPAFPGQDSGLRPLGESSIPESVIALGEVATFELRAPGDARTYLAVAEPLRLEPDAEPLGAIVVAKPEAVLRDQWLPLAKRLVVAFLVGSVLAGILGWRLSRRITRPVLALARASDEIAAGNYAFRVPETARDDEIRLLSERFNEMAARLGATEERERQFLMSVSHELRTPLTAIKGHIDALRDGLVDDPELIAVSLDVVANEALRLERLVGDVLDLAKLRAHRFTVHSEEVDMGRLAELAYGAFGDEARRREIDFRLDLADDPPTISTDGDRVLQIVTNLLTNAFHWTPDGGSISLALRSAGTSIRVEVVDSGPGVNPTQRERIFNPFVSGDTQGTGLGLPIARELANALGGFVEVVASDGPGSVFRLVLPLRSPAKRAGAAGVSWTTPR